MTDSEEGVFETYKDALVFAAALGAFHGDKEPFEESSEPIPFEYFRRKADNEALFLLLALHDTEDIDILRDDRQEERLEIFESYANGGLNRIEREVSGRPPLDAVNDLVAVAKSAEGAEQTELSEIVTDLGL